MNPEINLPDVESAKTRKELAELCVIFVQDLGGEAMAAARNIHDYFRLNEALHFDLEKLEEALLADYRAVFAGRVLRDGTGFGRGTEEVLAAIQKIHDECAHSTRSPEPLDKATLFEFGKAAIREVAVANTLYWTGVILEREKELSASPVAEPHSDHLSPPNPEVMNGYWLYRDEDKALYIIPSVRRMDLIAPDDNTAAGIAREMRWGNPSARWCAARGLREVLRDERAYDPCADRYYVKVSENTSAVASAG